LKSPKCVLFKKFRVILLKISWLLSYNKNTVGICNSQCCVGYQH
jgi:hypothetical protein